ncbi:hypothetical protein B0H13DRAFT_2524872 [Mycena leptocephala]|nr:hypothetical protein B0H13DRAFT_2524872 [Mycena leptocephala]
MDARGAPHLSTLPPRLPMARCRAAQQSIGIIYLLFGKKPGAMLLGSKRGGRSRSRMRSAVPASGSGGRWHMGHMVFVLSDLVTGDQWNHAGGRPAPPPVIITHPLRCLAYPFPPIVTAQTRQLFRRKDAAKTNLRISYINICSAKNLRHPHNHLNVLCQKSVAKNEGRRIGEGWLGK